MTQQYSDIAHLNAGTCRELPQRRATSLKTVRSARWSTSSLYGRLLGTVTIAIVAVSAAASDDLVDVFHLAQQRDPRFQAVEANLAAIKETKPQARARLIFPTIGASANTTYNEQDIDTASPLVSGNGGFFRFNTRGYSINLTQPIFHWDRYVQFKQAESSIRQARFDVDAAMQDLLMRVAERYFEILAAQDNLEFSTAEKAALNRQFAQSQERYDVGLIAITDLQEAKAGYDSSIADEIEANNQLENSREALREFTGEYAEKLAPLRTNTPLISPDPADPEQWSIAAAKQNPRLLSSEAAAEVAAEEINVQRAGHMPTIDIVGSYGSSVEGGRFGTTDTDASAIGVQFNLPIYSGGIVQSRTREAEHKREVALQSAEEQRRAAIKAARNAYSGIITGISRVKALDQAVISAETALNATQAGFEVGTRTAVDVVTQVRELLRAKRDRARARYDYILNTLRLKEAAGRLIPEDLVAVNSWLESEH